MSTRLFQPLKVGNSALQHRVALAPLTRYRADDDHVPTSLQVEYYRQRASVPGTLLVTEATFITKEGGGYNNVPGIWNAAQIDGWRKVTDAVHENESFIYLQLWHLGRAADADVALKEGFTVKSSSPLAIDKDHATPVALTIDEIKQTVQDYAQAARNAIAAGFDGVEVHAANGYLIDQFLQDKVNSRTDEYGGSVENRSRFAYEVTQAVVAAVGAERTGIRLSPFSVFQGMRMDDLVPQFSDILRKINPLGLAYVHFVQAYSWGPPDPNVENDKLDWALELLDVPVLIAGGLATAEEAKKLVDETFPNKDIVATFGRYFISNPDLPFRLREGLELTKYNWDTFYLNKSPVGYVDQAFSAEFEKLHGVQIREAN